MGSSNAPYDPFSSPAEEKPLMYRWQHREGERRCDCQFAKIMQPFIYECQNCMKLLPGHCLRCQAKIDPERMGDLCDKCIAEDRKASAKVINAMHPGNRLRTMMGQPLLPEDPASAIRLREMQIKHAHHRLRCMGSLSQIEAIANHYCSVAKEAMMLRHLLNEYRHGGGKGMALDDLVSASAQRIKLAHATDLGLELDWNKPQ
jgi:hypothetical protein